MFGELALLLCPCLDALNDPVHAAAVPVAVVLRNLRHPLAPKAHPDPDLDAFVGHPLDQGANLFLHGLTPDASWPSNLLISLGPLENSTDSFPQSLSRQMTSRLREPKLKWKTSGNRRRRIPMRRSNNTDLSFRKTSERLVKTMKLSFSVKRSKTDNKIDSREKTTLSSSFALFQALAKASSGLRYLSWPGPEKLRNSNKGAEADSVPKAIRQFSFVWRWGDSVDRTRSTGLSRTS